MTTKQIAEAAGCTPETVRVKGKELFPNKFQNGKKTEFTQVEAIQVMKNLRVVNYIEAADSMTSRNLEVDRLDRLEAMVSRLVEAVAAMLPRVATPAPLSLPAPALSPRDELRQIIGRAARESGDYQGTWRDFYEAIYYRMHRKVRECAKNRGIDSLDYLEGEGLLPEAIALARDIFEAK